MPQPPGPVDLGARDPRVGETVLFEGREYEVTGRSTYKNDEGYRTVEWCVEDDDTENYILKEFSADDSFKWFFTRWIDPLGVDVAGMGSLASLLRSNQKIEPPKELIYKGTSYAYADSTEGTFEEDGQTVPKTTWDYWDTGRKKNLAVETWGDGGFDFYLGAYIDASDVVIREARGGGGAGGGLGSRIDNPFLATAIAFACAFAFQFFMIGLPFDTGAGFSLVVAMFFIWSFLQDRSPLLSGASLAGAVLLGALFWRFAPLTTPLGLTGLLAAPAAIGWLARGQTELSDTLVPQFMAFFSVVEPLLILGLYYYLKFAPGPHTLSQLCLALGPAALGGVAALGVSGYLMASAEKAAPGASA